MTEFDVLGQDNGRPNFIRHLGLASVPGSEERVRVSVYEMGPPLQASGFISADVQATATLNDDESRKIRSFIDQHQGEHEARRLGTFGGYCVFPHVREEFEDDGTYLYSRFSCAGFVVEAYRFAGIDLIDLETVPSADLDAVAEAYPDYRERLADERWQKRLGIEEGFPVPIVFCGYVIHSLNRTPEQIRAAKYAPVVANATFP